MNYPYRSKILDQLGVRSWINARNWSTVIGGDWIDDRVLDAMNEVAKTFVDMHELFEKADKRVAQLCRVDDAHITAGCGAAIETVVAGCMAGDDYGKWMKLPDTEGMKNEVVMPRGHYIGYTPQWRSSGAKLVEYGEAGTLKSFQRELDSAITDKTCCLSYTVSYNIVPRGMIPVEEVIEAGKRHSIPVVIDAASDLPPVANLHKYTDMGADIVCVSGGKAIKAPNNTGILLGKGKGAEIIKAVRDYTFPHYGWGRGHKISKEQIVGLVVALEIFIKEGDSLYEKQMKTAEFLVKELSGIPDVDVDIIPNDETFHEHTFVPHVPRVRVEWDAGKLGLTAREVDEAMAREDPPIYLRNIHYSNYYTNKEWRLIDTFFLRDGEEKIVAERMKRVITRKF
ncbi:MAG: aminotransferase class V-fold PLP-dependent enzyme [Deltaproteobacteria bacterium]|nr:aminotransferase class V-fold PLP-dependent enzyme [Deltaproteobacteria bacterium]